jgi:hypothetical protein
MRKALKPGGLLIIQGYAPKQLQYSTGGPKEIGNLYTRAMLEEAFRDFHDVAIAEEELELYEGTSHGGMWHVSRHQSDGTKVASPNGASPDLTITSR